MTQQDKLIANEHKIMAILQAFSLDESGEVNVSLYNVDDDEETSYTFSNIKKIIETVNSYMPSPPTFIVDSSKYEGTYAICLQATYTPKTSELFIEAVVNASADDYTDPLAISLIADAENVVVSGGFKSEYASSGSYGSRELKPYAVGFKLSCTPNVPISLKIRVSGDLFDRFSINRVQYSNLGYGSSFMKITEIGEQNEI